LEGEIVTFQIAVENNGAAQATNVSLTDLLPTGLTATGNNGTVTQGSYDAVTGIWTVGTLATGGSATLTLEGTVDVGEGGNTITNITTSATGDQPDPTTAGDDLTEAVDVDANADLVTVKTLASGNSQPAEGETVTFLIAVGNDGAAQATNVSLTDLLPAGLTATAGNGSVSQGSYDAATGLWTIGTLETDDSATLTLEGTVNAGEGGNTITNITTAATGDQPDPTTAGDDLSEAVDVDPNADLVTVKTLTSGNSTPLEGDTVTFLITVDNNGSAQATNVSLTDLLPQGLTATANNGMVDQGAYDATTGVWSIGTLATGASATLTLEGTVNAGEGGNTISNVTTAATGDQPDPTGAGDDLSEAVDVDPGPTAVDETVTVPFETPVQIDPLANDSDPEGEPLTITAINGVPLTPGVAQTIAVPNATVTIAADGTITVTPDSGFSGTIDVPYTIVDQDGASSTASHFVEVGNAPPVIEIVDQAPDAPSIDPADPNNIIVPAIDGQPLTIDLDEYLIDPEGDGLTIDFESLPEGATFDPATNELTFIPTIDNNGDTVLPVSVIDSAGNEITPTITIQPINPAPVAAPEVVETTAETPVVVDFLANDTDPDNDTISLLGAPVLLDPASGTLELIGEDWVFTPAPGYSGTAVIAYTLQDQDGNTATSTHSVVVASVSFVEPGLGEATPELVYVEEPQTPTDILGSDYERGFHRIPTDAELVILSMAEELSSLNGADKLVQLHTIDNQQGGNEHDLMVRSLESTTPGSEGFSSGKGYRGTLSIDPTDECGRFFIDTIIREEMLSVIARSTIDPEQSSGVIGFSATLADGSPLPVWVSQLADGEYLIDRTIDLEVVALRIVAHRADGSTLIRVVAIDTLTGEIREQEQLSNFGSSFSEELRSDTSPVKTVNASIDK
jgi:uncharacterized repeat protein (TIGR01451 family)